MNLNDLIPTLLIVMGGAGSGKNHYIEPHYPNYHLIDVDAIKGEVGVKAAIGQVKPLLLAAFKNKVDIAHPTTVANLTAVKNKIDAAHEHGYNVHLVLVSTPTELAIKQVEKRVGLGGHDVELQAIISSNQKARANFEAVRGLADVSGTHVRAIR